MTFPANLERLLKEELNRQLCLNTGYELEFLLRQALAKLNGEGK